MIKFLCLGSGSSGNCYLFRSPHNTILVDAGLGIRTLRKALKDNGVTIDSIDAVFITHDHADHIKAVGHLAHDFNRPIYATEPAHQGINRNYCVTQKLTPQHQRIVVKGATLDIGDFHITPFPVPHDSTDCVGYRIQVDETVFCLITDAGEATLEMQQAVTEANYLVLESNHDEEMLANGPYPSYLKGRIRGNRGHLSNHQCGELLANHASPCLKHVWLCHLSEENNHPELARKTVEQILRSYGILPGVDFRLDILKRKVASPFYELE